jgi:uncharacterized OB-fold protein
MESQTNKPSRQEGYLTGNRCAKCGKLTGNENILCFECNRKEKQANQQQEIHGKTTEPYDNQDKTQDSNKSLLSTTAGCIRHA